MQRQSIFNNLQTDEQREQFKKAFPEGKKKKKQSPANALTSAVIQYIRLQGGCAARINVMGVYDQSTGKYRASGSTKGVEDVDAVMPVNVSGLRIGLKVAVEIKIGRDTQSDDQKQRQSDLTKAGGVYIIAKTFDQFKQDWDNIKHRYEYSSKI